jgi:lysophospholipase L1-like esterase
MRRVALIVAPLLVAGSLFAWNQFDRHSFDDGPRVVASLGDSITRAFNPDRSSAFKEEIAYSWSTGDEPYIRSHVDRLRALGADLEVYNNAVSGARSADLRRQMRLAIQQRADYVTIEIGANDVCALNGPTVEQFRENVRAALAKYAKQLPEGRVFLASIPDVRRLWEVLRTNPAAQTVWQTFGICPSMLSVARTEAERTATISRQKEYNVALAELCAEFRQCRFDGFAVYTNDFVASDVSNVDYFHPSMDGQRRLAEITWKASYWSDAP